MQPLMKTESICWQVQNCTIPFTPEVLVDVEFSRLHLGNILPCCSISTMKPVIRQHNSHHVSSQHKVEPGETRKRLESQAPLSAETGQTSHTAADGLVPNQQDTATQPTQKTVRMGNKGQTAHVWTLWK